MHNDEVVQKCDGSKSSRGVLRVTKNSLFFSRYRGWVRNERSAGSAAVAETFEITVKNLTYAQIFSPPVAVAHSRRLRVFEAGEPAGPGLEILAEDGTPGPLMNELITAGADVAVNGDASPAPVLPGESATFRVTARGANRRISVVGMLITTNDAFFGLNSARTPERQSRTVRVVAYDAGTEVNDESCAHIPGPPCGNAGNEDGEPGEIGVPENGVVHIHLVFTAIRTA